MFILSLLKLVHHQSYKNPPIVILSLFWVLGYYEPPAMQKSKTLPGMATRVCLSILDVSVCSFIPVVCTGRKDSSLPAGSRACPAPGLSRYCSISSPPPMEPVHAASSSPHSFNAPPNPAPSTQSLLQVHHPDWECLEVSELLPELLVVFLLVCCLPTTHHPARVNLNYSLERWTLFHYISQSNVCIIPYTGNLVCEGGQRKIVG